MYPLRFPNSGIRAKVFVRKIGFKLRVMRLYRVESFYTFLLRFRSKGSEEEGRPATTSPHAGPATHNQAAAKASPQGWRLWARRARLPPAAHLQGGRPLATSPQGATARDQPCRLRRGSGDNCKERARAFF
ncbi:hypothetical protein GW17_00045741 [Ensete ventricosum]|nr:hypothetical protein GW17_00045741 [Ensete ventricosum]